VRRTDARRWPSTARRIFLSWDQALAYQDTQKIRVSGRSSKSCGDRALDLPANSRLLAFVLLASSCGAQAQVLFANDTESELPHKVEPPNDVVRLIWQAEREDAVLLNECLAEKGLSRNESTKLFSAERIALNGDASPDYFVRPALDPYCHAFYGAHLFRYWFVSGYRDHGRLKYRIIFKNGGDAVRMLATTSNGHRDLELEGHNAVASYISTWRFNGRQYVPKGCIKRMFDNEGGASSCD